MKRLNAFFLFLILIFFLNYRLCIAKNSVDPEVVDFLSGFKATRLVNDIVYCATEGGLRIYDVKDRTNPQILSEIIVSESLNVDLEIAGSYVYILSGYIWLEQSYITVIDISNPLEPKIISKYSDLEDTQVTDLLIQDHWLIVANGENIDFLDITDPSHLKRVSRVTITTFEGSVRGLALHDKTLFGVWENFGDSGLDAVDISNINQPTKIVTYYYPRLNGYQRPSGFLTVSGSTLYVSVPTLGLLIFDAKTPEYLVPVTSMEGETFYGIDALYAEDDFLFMNLQKIGKQEIAVFDISNPTSPSLISQSELSASVNGMDFDPSRREAYLGIYPSSGYGMGIFQLTQDGDLTPISAHTVSSPTDVIAIKGKVFLTASNGLIAGKIVNRKLKVISKIPLSNQVGSMKIVGTRAYVTTSNNSGRSFLNTIDIRDPAQMKLIGKHLLKGVPGYLAQDSFDVEGTQFYFAGINGLSILDGSNPDQLQQIGFFPIEGSSGPGLVEVDKGVAYVGTLHWRTANGVNRIVLDLYIIDIRKPQSPRLIVKKTVSFATVLTDIAVKDGYLYLMFAGFGSNLLPVGDGQLAIVDVRTLSKPEVLFSGYTRKRGKGYAEEIAFRGAIAFIADGLEGVTVLNLANKSRPEIVATLTTPGHARAVSVDNDGKIHIADNSSYLVYQWP